jgi:chromosome segregation ATPase
MYRNGTYHHDHDCCIPTQVALLQQEVDSRHAVAMETAAEVKRLHQHIQNMEIEKSVWAIAKDGVHEELLKVSQQLESERGERMGHAEELNRLRSEYASAQKRLLELESAHYIASTSGSVGSVASATTSIVGSKQQQQRIQELEEELRDYKTCADDLR